MESSSTLGLFDLHSHPHSTAGVTKSVSVTSPPFVVDHLSTPQISRACAAAIRISVSRGDIWDGFHLWHSLRWSMHRYRRPGSGSTPQSPLRTPSPFVPIDFARPVSARLAAHSLLHGLLRAGETKNAAILTEQMMADGEELHPMSFNTLIRQLHSSNSGSPQTVYNRMQRLTSRQRADLGPRVLELQNVMPMDPFTSIAVRLLNNAREHRWQRTTSMYEIALRACLIQGEILVASLLLVLLLKDYQMRNACSRAAAEAERVGEQDITGYIYSKIPKAPSRGFKLLPHSNSRLLYQGITKLLAKHSTHIHNPLFDEASQALAVLASALDARRIPYANLAPLIKLMYSYPQCQHTVWITSPSGERRSRNAYRYFHEVLLNLLCSLSDKKLDRNSDQRPSLNSDSYNTLLHYALRYRHSIPLANHVLHHMTELREPPLAPTVATYNILLRGSTLMRRNDIAESVLRITPGRMPDNKPEVVHHSPPRTLQRRNSQIDSCLSDAPWERHLLRFRELLEDTRKSGLNIPKPKGHIKPDTKLLTSYMAHLVATGRPDEVAILITRVIPEFEPPQKCLTPEELMTRWQTCVVRGVALGPHFFATALNALRKAGLWKLARRVWALAEAAETKSLHSSVTPWCLSVHAYTAMLQLYANETKGWYPENTATCVNHSEHPPRPRDPKRAVSGIRKGMQIFRALSIADIKLREAAVRARREGREWKRPPSPPIADARFYNAALRLVCRLPGMRPRGSSRWSHSRWNRGLGKARLRFWHTGQMPRGWTPELQEIAKSLSSSGYALPIGFRYRLVGRDKQTTSQDRTDFGARPYSFGRRSRAHFAPYRLPTVKRKGLPFRGRWRRSGWSDKRLERDYSPERQVVG